MKQTTINGRLKMLIGGRSGAYELSKAIRIASELQSDEDELKFEVVDCKNGLGRIDVYDAEGLLIHEGFVM